MKPNGNTNNPVETGLHAAILTPQQQETVEHFKSYNVPAQWFVGVRNPNGSVEVLALGDGFVWSFDIEADGTHSAQEAQLSEDGFSTGVSI